MRFTLIKDLKQDNVMGPVLNGLLVFILLYLVAEILVKHFSFGLFPSQIFLTLYGNEEEFLDPINQAAFLEFWHIEIFMTMMLLLTLSSVFIRITKNQPQRHLLHIVMLSALSALVFLLLAYFISSSFVYAYFVTYALWHLAAIYMALYSLWKLNSAKSI